MPLLLLDLDLDNTLVDRAGAYRRWAARFARTHDRDDELQWLVAADGDGFEPRERVAARIRTNFGLSARAEADVLAELRRGLVEEIQFDHAVIHALARARAAGWVPVVVTNGTVQQQERKLRHTGLDRHVADWVISEQLGVKKPDPQIFRRAAEQVGSPLRGGWMIGDSATADVAGAQNVALRSIWLHRGRTWTEPAYRPDIIADSCPAAIDSVITTG